MKPVLELWKDGKPFAKREIQPFVTEEWLNKELRPTGTTLADYSLIINANGTLIRIHSLADIVKA